MLGKFLASTVRIINAPAKAIDKLVDPHSADLPEISTPLEKLAEALEEVDE